MYPAFHAKVFHTSSDTPYLQEPGVVMISAPSVDIGGMYEFLAGFEPELNFLQYLDDGCQGMGEGEELCKTAGQLCYFSFGPNRTMNADGGKYFENIRSSGHGSVLEHANYTFLFYGVSRSFTHELVRHRVGVGISQVSQRYVSGKTLRFVERPEYVDNPTLHESFEVRIDNAAHDYDTVAAYLQTAAMADQLVHLSKTERRKAVNQAARSVLPNETEAPIIITGNVRALRHIIEMRASRFAEPEIRRAAVNLYRCMVIQEPVLFADYREVILPDGSIEVVTDTAKV